MAKPNTSKSQFKPLHGPSGGRCTETAPRVLYGPIGMPPRCMLLNRPDGPHTGLHRATYSVQSVGKVLFKWKTQPSDGFRPSEPRKGRRPDALLTVADND